MKETEGSEILRQIEAMHARLQERNRREERKAAFIVINGGGLASKDAPVPKLKLIQGGAA